MAVSKRIRFGRRSPLGLLRLDFASEIDAGDGKRKIDFRWEPDPKRRESGDRPEHPAGE